MTIAQALKEKNRILNQIKKVKDKITQHNQVVKGNERPYDIESLYTELIELQDSLTLTKTAIHNASAEVRNTIFLQSELKDRLTFLRKIPQKNGIVRERYSSEDGYEVESTFGPKEIDELTDKLENQIESIQDKLDKFNHTTEVNL